MCNIEINREIDNIYYAKVTLLNDYLQEIKSRRAIYYSRGSALVRKFNDIYYVSPHYLIAESLDDKYYLYNNYAKKIIVENSVYLNPLLDYLGFPLKFNNLECRDLLKNVFNGTLAYDFYEEFGYQKKPNRIWKNGKKIPNPDMPEGTDYNINKYELADSKNRLAEFFPLLCEVDYKNPERIFEPFEEEGPIKKRDLK